MNKERSIIGACDYTTETLKKIKKTLIKNEAEHKEINWAIGGILISLTSNLLKIASDQFLDATKNGNHSAKTDLTEIKENFNKFIEKMIGDN